MEQVIKPGMFVYADNFISEELIPDRQVKAVVGYAEKNTVYAVCLQETYLPWSSDYVQVKDTRDMTDGREATRKIVEAAWKKGKKAEAAQWCYDYAKDGVQPGEAFLASLAEWEKIFPNKAAINASLEKLGAEQLGGIYRSSTEYDYRNAWGVHMTNGNRTTYSKPNRSSDYVRPIITIQI